MLERVKQYSVRAGAPSNPVGVHRWGCNEKKEFWSVLSLPHSARAQCCGRAREVVKSMSRLMAEDAAGPEHSRAARHSIGRPCRAALAE